MTSNTVFVSYARRHQAEVKNLIKYLEDVGLDVWFDGHIRTGDFRDWIADGIQKSRAMIVVLTKDSVGPKSSGWIEREIDMARDSAIKDLILPCVIGDFVMPRDLAEKITFLQSVSCDKIDDLPKNEEFRSHVQYLKELVENRVSPAKPGFTRADARTPADWFAADPAPTTSEISLAMATMLLEYQPADLVVEAARELERNIETSFGEKTEEERAKEPRALSMMTATERFEAIGAERATLPDPSGSAQPTVLRFKDRNWRGALLRHVWDEMDHIREVVFDWMTERLKSGNYDPLDDAIVRTLGSLAQHDLYSLRHRLLDDWLLPVDSLRPVYLASDIIGSAAENEANLKQIRDMLLPLANPKRGRKAIRHYFKFLALTIALGRVALRRPDISIEVLKVLGREVFRDDALRNALLRSPAIFGRKEHEGDETLSDLGFDQTNPEEEKEEEANLDTSTETTLPDLNDEGPELKASRAVPAASFLAALADWAEEPAKNTDEVLERHLPFAALLHAFFGMPLLSTEDSTRLTLEDLMGPIYSKDPEIVHRIANGFARAGMAKMRLNYLPRRDMQLVFKSFARERAKKIKDGEKMPNPDPYLSFAGQVYGALSERNEERANLVIEGSARWLTDADRAAILFGEAVSKFQEEKL